GGARYDLGLIEALFLFALAIVFYCLDSRVRRPGFFFAAYFCVYGPFRFLLDRLHVDPPRYFGWSVDQYAALAATIAGLLIAAASFRTARKKTSEEKNATSFRAVSAA